MSANTQSILLLTAPLMLGSGDSKASASADLLKPSEYQRLARYLVDIGKQPEDLLSSDAEETIDACSTVVERARLRSLLERGLQLSQAVERWKTRAIWVVSRADAAYPRVLKSKLKARAPAVLYGCGNIELLGMGGLAVVGSRRVSDPLVKYAEGIGSLAARASCTVISGGARGVDRAAMDGALRSGGRVVGVLAEEIEREAMQRLNRDPLRSGRLVLVSEYDPCSRFSIGHAMQRNKLIYALANHALVVNSDLEKGGTWAGAVEQLDKLHLTPVFVRSTGEVNPALDALVEHGAHPWPNPSAPDNLLEQLSRAVERPTNAESPETAPIHSTAPEVGQGPSGRSPESPADALFRTVQDVVLSMLEEPKSETEVADLLDVTKGQVREWLKRMVDRGLILRSTRPIRYSMVRRSSQAETGV
ncbi:MAG: DNA-processing protein DprA [Myxococcota bacterium]